jgi:Protein of unknown function (DUF2889)
VIRPADPRSDFPRRESPSVRRVMFLDYDWIDLVDLRVRGGARDEVTDASGVTHVEREASADVETSGGLLTKIDVEPAELDVADLLGQPLRQGFRARVRATHDGGGRPLGLLLDDLPGAMIAAGYVHAMERRIGPGTTVSTVDRDEMPRGFHQADLCSGWRSDGTMMLAVYAGEALPFEPIAEVPQVPDGADGWPETAIPVPGLRRYRRIDIVPDGAVWRIDAWFRDTYRNSDGECGALHEYTVLAVADAVDHTLLEVSAIPHALPWKECPAAGEMVGKLVGTPLDGLRSSVPKVLQGIESCTHLTNELRELADVPYLAASLANT